MRLVSFRMMVVLCGALVLACAVAAHAAVEPWAGVPRLAVKEAIAQPDDTRVVVEGTIKALPKHEEYELTDASATVIVEIDDKYWQGVKAKDGEKVRVYAEVDVERKGVKLDAKKVEILGR